MKKAALLLVMILSFTIIIPGCQPMGERRPITPDQQNKSNNMQYDDNRNMSERFERLAEQVPGVKDATVAVSTPNQNGAELGVLNPDGDKTTPRGNQGTTPGGTQGTTPGGTQGTTPGGTQGTTPGGTPGGAMGDRTMDDRTRMNQDQQMNNDRRSVNEIPSPNNRTNNNTGSLRDNIVVMVGLVLETPNRDMGDIEQQVERRIRADNNRVSQVLFTTDGGMIDQINNVNDNIRRGTSVDTIQRDLDRLTRSLTTNP